MASFVSWQMIDTLGKSRVLRSSYYWMFAVPVVIKIGQGLPEYILIRAADSDIAEVGFFTSLPFSWHFFYWGAILASLANILYQLNCPKIIKDFRTFGDFVKDGQNVIYLSRYVEEHNSNALSKDEKSNLTALQVLDNASMAIIFWKIHNEKNSSRAKRFFLCGFVYLLASLAFLFVLFQNIAFVVEGYNLI